MVMVARHNYYMVSGYYLTPLLIFEISFFIKNLRDTARILTGFQPSKFSYFTLICSIGKGYGNRKQKRKDNIVLQFYWMRCSSRSKCYNIEYLTLLLVSFRNKGLSISRKMFR